MKGKVCSSENYDPGGRAKKNCKRVQPSVYYVTRRSRRLDNFNIEKKTANLGKRDRTEKTGRGVRLGIIRYKLPR